MAGVSGPVQRLSPFDCELAEILLGESRQLRGELIGLLEVDGRVGEGETLAGELSRAPGVHEGVLAITEIRGRVEVTGEIGHRRAGGAQDGSGRVVQAHATTGGDRLIADLAQHGVREGEAPGGGGNRHDDAEAGGTVQGVENVGQRSVEDLRACPCCELGAEHGSGVDRRSVVLRDPLEAGGDVVAQRGAHRNREQNAVGGQLADDLAQEQRAAGRRLVEHARGARHVQRRATGGGTKQRFDVGLGEPAQPDPPHRGMTADVREERRQRARQVGSNISTADYEQDGAAGRPDDVTRAARACRSGPVDVLDHDERTRRACAGGSRHGPEQRSCSPPGSRWRRARGPKRSQSSGTMRESSRRSCQPPLGDGGVEPRR